MGLAVGGAVGVAAGVLVPDWVPPDGVLAPVAGVFVAGMAGAGAGVVVGAGAFGGGCGRATGGWAHRVLAATVTITAAVADTKNAV